MGRSGPIGTVENGITVAIRLTPRAKMPAIHPEIIDGPSGPSFKASVTAPPIDGAANAALIMLLAKTWRVPKSSLEIVGGARRRDKLVLARGDTAVLRTLVETWLGARGEA